MNSDVRKHFRGVVSRIFGVCALLAVLVISGCTNNTPPPVLTVTTTSSALPTGIVNVAYTPTTLAAVNGTGSLSWKVASGNMPTGTSLSTAGVISGTPTASGTFTFGVQVTDSATPAPNTATANLTILVNPALATVVMAPNTVVGGTNSTGTVTLTGPAIAAATVKLASNNSAVATVPANVTVAAGASTATFTVTTTVVAASATATITGTYGVSQTGTLTVNPPTVASVTLTAGTLTGGTGTTSGIVTLTGPAATGGDVVTLSSNNGAAVVPGNVTVAAGQTSATFNVTTTVVTSSQTATLQASYNNSSKTTTVTVVPAPSISSFVAAAGTITSGNSTTLKGVFANGTGSVSGGVGTVTNGQVVTVQPTTTTTYTLTVTNAAGTSMTATATVTVVAAPTITSFTPAAATITAGSSTTLTGVFANGTGSVNNGVGAVTTNVAATVTPTSTTTYTLTVTNAAGTSMTATTTVTVVAAPTITSFTPAAATITSGLSGTTLTAVFANGIGSVDNGIGTVTSNTAVPVNPATTTTYNLTVTNAAGSTATAQTTVTVVPPPSIASFIANPSTIVTGSSSTLIPTFTGGTGTIDNGVGAVTSGTGYPVSPTTSTTYTLTVKNAATTPATATMTAQVTVDIPPTITSASSKTFVINSFSTFTVQATGFPTSALTYTGSLPTGVTFVDNGNGTATISGTHTGSANSYPITITANNGVSPNATQTFTLTTSLVVAPAITSPNNVTFTAGASGSFTVTTTGSPTPTLTEAGGLPGTVTFHDNGNGTATISGSAPSPGQSVITITASNSVGPVNQTFTLNVVAAPVITSFTASPASITTGSPSTLTAVFTGGTGSVNNSVGTVTSNTGVSVSPSTTTTYTLTVTNAATTPASVTATATVTVYPAPAIASFTATSTTIAAGTSTTLTPTFSNGTGTINSISGNVTSGSSYPVTPATTTTYTLTVTNGAGSTTTSTVTITVIGPPTITKSFGANAIPVGGSTTLNFTIQNSNPSVSLTGVGFSDTLTGGLVVSSTPAVTGSCGAGTITAVAGATSVSLSGGTLAASSSCSFSVSVTGNSPGTIPNTTSAVTSNEGGNGTVSNTVSLSVLAAPVVTLVNPSTAGNGASITVSGSNFGSSQASVSGSVTVNGVSATVTSWSSTSLSMTVPPTATGTGYVVVTVLGVASATGPNSAFTVQTCTNNCTFSGTLSLNGSGFANLTLTLTGPSPSTTAVTSTTNGSGGFSFTNLTANGSYTLTAPAGYTYSPSMPYTVQITSNTTQNFTATPTAASDTISGTVSYTGTKTGRLYIRVYNTSGNCSGNCNNLVAGTSFTLSGSSGNYTGSYTINGLQAGQSYIVQAEIDTLKNGVPNSSNPNGASATFAVSQNYAVPNIALSDPTPPAPVALCGVQVAPGSTFALVQYNQGGGSGCSGSSLLDSNGREINTSYEIDWSTSSTFATFSSATFPAHGTNDRVYVASGLTTGTYYFRMFGLVGSTKSAASATASATLAAGTGTDTVKGQISFTLPAGVSSAGGPLYVGLFNGTQIYGQEISLPYTSPVSYSIPNVPAGSYQMFAIVKMDTSGVIEPSDISNVNNNQGGPPPYTVSGTGTTQTNNIPLTTAVSTIEVTTFASQYLTNSPYYSLSLGIGWGTDRPVAMQLISGPNVPLPWDMPVDNNNTEQSPSLPNGVAPNVGDTYQFQVTLYNPKTQATTTQTMTGSVSAVLAYANSLQMNLPVNGTSATIPMLNWAAPSPAPTLTPYTYNVGIYDPNNSGGVSWYYSGGNNSNGIPSSTTNILFNSDGSATSTALVAGTLYDWYVTVSDNVGNQSQITTTYLPSNGAGPATKLGFVQQPGNTTAGSTIPNFSVAVQDTNGLTVLNATNAITVALLNNPGGSSLVGNTTVNAVNGVAVFSGININNPGSGYTLQATVSGNTLTAATSTGFNVAGTATQIGFVQQPTGGTAGATMSQVQVAVEDGSGNVVTTANNSITLSLNQNGNTGTLSGTLTQSAVNGVATFNNLSVSSAGTGYTLQASSAGFGNVNSSSFAISAGVAATCTSAPTGKESFLSGHYVAMIEGWEGTGPGSPYEAVFTFDANGIGGFTDVSGGSGITGNIDLNRGSQGASSVFSGNLMTSGGTYKVGLDPTNNSGYLGCMTVKDSNSNTYVMRFALGVVSSNATHGRIMTWMDASGNGSGIRASGTLIEQDPTAFTLTSLHPNYAFGENGWSAPLTHFAIAGDYSLNTTNGSAVAIVDTDNGGTISSQQTVPSTFSGLSSKTGRAVDVGTSPVSHTAVYVVNANEMFLIGIDPFTSGSSMYLGRAIVTGTSFSNSSLNGNYTLQGTSASSGNSGCNSGGNCAQITLGVLALSGGSFNTGSTIYNYSADGTTGIQSKSLAGGTYAVAASGRMTTAGLGNHSPVLYLATPQSNTEPFTGFVVGTDSAAFSGFVGVGSSTAVSVSSLAGNRICGTGTADDSMVQHYVCAVNLSSTGAVSGYQYASDTSGLSEGSIGGASFSISNSPLPGVGNLGSSTSIAITDGTHIWFVDAGGSLNNPAVITVVTP